MSAVDIDSDEEESLTLSRLKAKLQTKNTSICDTEDDIPLNILAKTIKEGQNNQSTSEKHVSDKQEQFNVHTVDHLDYFRATCENGDVEVDRASSESSCVNTELSEENVSNKNDVDSMECDGIFGMNETDIVDDDEVQELNDVSLNLDVLRPLFDIPDTASETSFYMILGNEVIPEVDVHDEDLTIGTDSKQESDKENEETGSDLDDDTDTKSSQMESDQEERPFRSRRHKKDPEKWKQNIRKRKRNAGEEYLSCKGKRIQRRTMQRPNCKCKYKCADKISEENQQTIFQNYWGNSYSSQRDFIKRHVRKEEKARKTTKRDSRRKNSYQYRLSNETETAQVCKIFFLKTLGIGEKTVSYTLTNKEEIGSEDKRGRKPGIYKISDDDRQFVREHIKSFPTVDSHYCRITTSRKYLGKDLSIKKMYELYKQKCEKEERTPVKYWLYDKIFGTEFNIGFHHPKKDVCTFCDSYEKLSPEDKEIKKHEHEKHLKRKQNSREQKAKDKMRSLTDEKIQVINFDLQKVLVTPKLFVSDAYYSRKLATYNFTTYDLSSRNVNCYVWDESQAKRGSCEIATCLLLHNRTAGEKEEVIYYSESCTGQQRNLQFCTMCLYSVTNLPIKTITHNYFERGHSQMEGDSVHATIENATKRLEMYSPDDWILGIKNAKQNPPKYNVTEIRNHMVIDFKECASSVISNRKKDVNGENVHWNKIHSFQYKKETPNIIYFKYEYSDNYKKLDVCQGRRRTVTLKDYKLKTLYKTRLSISAQKHADLMSLCNKGLIPSKHHVFYEKLPHDKKLDKLPEPHSSDESDSDAV